MKRIILAVVIGWVFGVGVYAAYAESKVIATPKVQVAEKTGDTDASIGPVYFPDFYKSKGEQKCRDYLSSLSNKKMLEYVNVRGFKDVDSVRHERKGSKEKCCMKDDLGSCADIVSCGKGDARGIDVQSDIGSLAVGDDDYYDLEGLSGEIEISPGYEKSSKVLFHWTVRVEGYLPKDCDHKTGKVLAGISVWPALCHPWHGTSYQDYGGGQVKTQLYIKGANETDADGASRPKDGDDYVGVGKPIEMTVPPMTKAKVALTTKSDPTLHGSYVLESSEFVDSLPDKIEYRLKWANQTPLRIKSPKGQRNLAVTLMPVTQE